MSPSSPCPLRLLPEPRGIEECPLRLLLEECPLRLLRAAPRPAADVRRPCARQEGPCPPDPGIAVTAPFLIEVLGPDHDRAVFSCGVETLGRYFREQVTQDVRR